MPPDSNSQGSMKVEDDTTARVGGVGAAAAVGDLIVNPDAAEEDGDWDQSQMSQVSQVSQMSTGAMLSTLSNFEPCSYPASK